VEGIRHKRSALLEGAMSRIEDFVRTLAHALGILVVLAVGITNTIVVTVLFRSWPAGLVVGVATVLTALAVHVWYVIRAH
jgi:hypothetical protein